MALRKTVYVQPEQLNLWADLETLADKHGRPTASLVLQALEEFSLLRAYRDGKADGARVNGELAETG